MGNCAHTTTRYPSSVRMVTHSGHILYFHTNQLVQDVLLQYPPGYGIFPSTDLSSPMPARDRLVSGGLYYLLALGDYQTIREDPLDVVACTNGRLSSGAPSDISDSAIEVLPSTDGGIWKVKFAIGTKELENILSEQANTEALIEKMREAAAMARSSPSPRQTKSYGRGLNWKSHMFYKKRNKSVDLLDLCVGF